MPSLNVDCPKRKSPSQEANLILPWPKTLSWIRKRILYKVPSVRLKVLGRLAMSVIRELVASQSNKLKFSISVLMLRML